MFAAAMVILGAAVPAGAVAAQPRLRTADDGARIVSQEWLDTYTFDFTVDSKAIGSNQKVRVLVPRGWRSQSTRSFICQTQIRE
jgi:aminopeptidase C